MNTEEMKKQQFDSIKMMVELYSKGKLDLSNLGVRKCLFETLINSDNNAIDLVKKNIDEFTNMPNFQLVIDVMRTTKKCDYFIFTEICNLSNSKYFWNDLNNLYMIKTIAEQIDQYNEQHKFNKALAFKNKLNYFIESLKNSYKNMELEENKTKVKEQSKILRKVTK